VVKACGISEKIQPAASKYANGSIVPTANASDASSGPTGLNIYGLRSEEMAKQNSGQKRHLEKLESDWKTWTISEQGSEINQRPTPRPLPRFPPYIEAFPRVFTQEKLCP
jgi:hypothetical protein